LDIDKAIKIYGYKDEKKDSRIIVLAKFYKIIILNRNWIETPTIIRYLTENYPDSLNGDEVLFVKYYSRDLKYSALIYT
jgi:hypothetical protein